jgi:predicted RNA-binding Zn ribbon-like protein
LFRYDATMAAKLPKQGKRRSETPREAQRLVDFLNSRAKGGKPDALATVESAKRALDALGIDGAALDAVGLERLRRLRDALTVLADRGRGDRGHSRTWDVVNEIAAGVPTAVRFVSEDESSVRSAGDGVDAIMGVLIADLHAAVRNGHWKRVRLCAYKPCSGAFYDATRSGTQRWHSYAVCGNRVNVAAHRRRTAAGSSKPAAS